MYMTEDEARYKWCPMSRRLDSTGISGEKADRSHNRLIVTSGTPPHYEDGGFDVPIDIGNNCMGSSCMLWRWKNLEPESGSGRCGLIPVIPLSGL